MWRKYEAAAAALAFMNVNPDFAVWEGVYGSFAEAPGAGQGFDGAVWRNRSLQAARETMTRAQAGEPFDYALRQRNATLPILTATLLAEQPRVSILDFGGGLATSYMVLTKAIPDSIDRVEYTVVEGNDICRAGRELFAGRTNPVFHSALPAAAQVDIVHAASVMQYIGDWRSVIRRLAGYGPRYLSLADFFIGEFATYVTLQHYYDSRVRHWFFNAGEFIGEVERAGYRLALRTPCDATILGRYGPLPKENFAPALRIAHTSNLLFVRRGAAP